MFYIYREMFLFAIFLLLNIFMFDVEKFSQHWLFMIFACKLNLLLSHFCLFCFVLLLLFFFLHSLPYPPNFSIVHFSVDFFFFSWWSCYMMFLRLFCTHLYLFLFVYILFWFSVTVLFICICNESSCSYFSRQMYILFIALKNALFVSSLIVIVNYLNSKAICTQYHFFPIFSVCFFYSTLFSIFFCLEIYVC